MLALKSILDKEWNEGIVFQNKIIRKENSSFICYLHSVWTKDGFISYMVPATNKFLLGFSEGSLSSYLEKNSRMFETKEEWNLGKFSEEDAEKLIETLDAFTKVSITGTYGDCELLGNALQVTDKLEMIIFYKVCGEIYKENIDVFQSYPVKSFRGYPEMMNALGLSTNFYVAMDING